MQRLQVGDFNHAEPKITTHFPVLDTTSRIPARRLSPHLVDYLRLLRPTYAIPTHESPSHPFVLSYGHSHCIMPGFDVITVTSWHSDNIPNIVNRVEAHLKENGNSGVYKPREITEKKAEWARQPSVTDTQRDAAYSKLNSFLVKEGLQVGEIGGLYEDRMLEMKLGHQEWVDVTPR